MEAILLDEMFVSNGSPSTFSPHHHNLWGGVGGNISWWHKIWQWWVAASTQRVGYLKQTPRGGPNAEVPKLGNTTSPHGFCGMCAAELVWLQHNATDHIAEALSCMLHVVLLVFGGYPTWPVSGSYEVTEPGGKCIIYLCHHITCCCITGTYGFHNHQQQEQGVKGPLSLGSATLMFDEADIHIDLAKETLQSTFGAKLNIMYKTK